FLRLLFHSMLHFGSHILFVFLLCLLPTLPAGLLYLSWLTGIHESPLPLLYTFLHLILSHSGWYLYCSIRTYRGLHHLLYWFVSFHCFVRYSLLPLHC